MKKTNVKKVIICVIAAIGICAGIAVSFIIGHQIGEVGAYEGMISLGEGKHVVTYENHGLKYINFETIGYSETESES